MPRLKQPKHSVFRDLLELQYKESIRYKLLKSVKASEDWVQRLGLLKVLPIHSGCVNCICWNENGDRLLSGSDDQHLLVTNGHNYKILTDYKTSHRANIFSAKFLPRTGDTGIVSCSGDGVILYTDLMRLEETHNSIFNCHVGTTYEITTIPNDPYTFISCGEDYTVRCFDLREKERCNKIRCTENVVICCQRPVTALAINSMAPFQLAIGCSDSTVRLYDRRMMSTNESVGGVVKPITSYMAPGMEGRTYRITSLSFSPGGEDILVSYSSEHLYLFGIQERKSIIFTQDPEILEDSDTKMNEQASATANFSVAPVRRLRLRGDWSDTGPDARPQNESSGARPSVSQARPTLHGTLMQRMTDVLSRMLNDPATRAALSHGGEDSLPEAEDQSSQIENNTLASQENNDSQGANESSDELVSVDQNLFSSSTIMEHNHEVVSEMSVDEDSENHQTEAVHDVSAQLPLSTNQNEENSDFCIGDGELSPSNQSSVNEIQNISSLKDQLSTMCNGFIEKHGTEPVVNLVYSDKGSTASRISMSVGDEVSRASTSSQPSSLPSSSVVEEMEVDKESKYNNLNDRKESSQVPESAEVQHLAEEPIFEHELNDDEFGDSDDDMEPVMRSDCNLLPEKDMDNIVQGESSKAKDDVLNVKNATPKQKYVGHRNARTMIKEATFWGSNYVISGSDCGHVFMWERQSAKLKMLLQADHHVVNCVQPHPHLPILATSGIDYDVKLWAPLREDPNFDIDMAEELMSRNAIMLEETKDTITVPASFMIRMLACLNQIRRGGRSRIRRRDPSASSD